MPEPARRRKPLVHHGEELLCSWQYEEEAHRAGHGVVAGADEVGRGALCGPVVACAVVLGPSFDPAGIDDSKRLTARQRERQAERIMAEAEGVSLGYADHAEIDRVDILRATWAAVQRAVLGLPTRPDLVLVDGLEVPVIPWPQRAIVKGDALSFSIAAAAIVAKVTRDALMREWDRQYPGYGMAKNMGYASEGHREALRRLGPSEIHRRTFQGTQRWLF